jgi:hypothetical protein
MTFPLSRRALLRHTGTGLGLLGLAGLLADEARSAPANPLAPKAPHFAPKAKRIIHLFMNGGPSQVDTFDPKPALVKYQGQNPPGSGLKTDRKTGGLLPSWASAPTTCASSGRCTQTCRTTSRRS